jgi:Type I restriction enzyme R protein N terminus (HSDR_N)
MSIKHIPAEFMTDSEDDLRLVVASFLQELGIESTELSCEDHFSIQLGHNAIIVNRESDPERRRVSGYSDVLITRNGRSLAIVETKSPDHTLTEQDAVQAISYARLLLQMAPFAIVTNGRDTQMYDTFAESLVPLDSGEGSVWNTRGQRLPTISEDLRYAASQTLIGINPTTLRDFCNAQVRQALTDLMGTVNQFKKYILEIYLDRVSIRAEFDAWLNDALPYFAVIGPSGCGKTNFMCATSEAAANDNFVLFYSSMRLSGGLVAAIRNDFIWEFHRERDIAYIIDRIDTLVRGHGRSLVIFVDGLDEFPGRLQDFKNELLDLAHRFRGRSIKLCLSCKDFDWSTFILDNRATYNSFALSVYPQRDAAHNPDRMNRPDPKLIGTWLTEFSPAELTAVFPRYKQAFDLKGELNDSTRIECQNPIVLRLVSEAYSGIGTELPTDISTKQIFEQYWDRRLGDIADRHGAEQLLVKLAKYLIDSARHQAEYSQFQRQVTWTDGLTNALNELRRKNIIVETTDPRGYRWLAFEIERIRNYVYTVKGEQWPLQDVAAVVNQICQSIDNPLAWEAVEFYVSSIDKGTTNLLSELGLVDLDCFLEIIHSRTLPPAVIEKGNDNAAGHDLFSRLVQFAEAYSKFSGHYFGPLCATIEPYTDSQVGIILTDSSYQLRARTPAYPQPVVRVTPEVASQLRNHTAPHEVYGDLAPAGSIYLGFSDLAQELPQKVAWNRITEQVISLISGRALDESSVPAILNERVIHALTHNPSIWVEQANAGQRFWQILGLDNAGLIYSTPITELKDLTFRAFEQFRQLAPTGLSNWQMNPIQRWYDQRCMELSRLHYRFMILQQHATNLVASAFTIDDMFSYLKSGNLDSVTTILSGLLPGILASYEILIVQNLPNLLGKFSILPLLNRHVLIEVTHDPFQTPFRSDFLTVCYIFLPNNHLPERHLVYSCPGDESIAHAEVIRRKKRGMVESSAHSMGSGRIHVRRQMGSLFIDEPDAFFCFTRFPSHHPILDQVYQLIGGEAKYVIGGDYGQWAGLEYQSTNDSALDHRIMHDYLSHHQ